MIHKGGIRGRNAGRVRDCDRPSRGKACHAHTHRRPVISETFDGGSAEFPHTPDERSIWKLFDRRPDHLEIPDHGLNTVGFFDTQFRGP